MRWNARCRIRRWGRPRELKARTPPRMNGAFSLCRSTTESDSANWCASTMRGWPGRRRSRKARRHRDDEIARRTRGEPGPSPRGLQRQRFSVRRLRRDAREYAVLTHGYTVPERHTRWRVGGKSLCGVLQDPAGLGELLEQP